MRFQLLCFDCFEVLVVREVGEVVVIVLVVGLGEWLVVGVFKVFYQFDGQIFIEWVVDGLLDLGVVDIVVVVVFVDCMDEVRQIFGYRVMIVVGGLNCIDIVNLVLIVLFGIVELEFVFVYDVVWVLILLVLVVWVVEVLWDGYVVVVFVLLFFDIIKVVDVNGVVLGMLE